MYEIKDLTWGDDNKTTVMDVEYRIVSNWLQSKHDDIVEQKYTMHISYNGQYGWETDEHIHSDSIEELKAKANTHWRGILEPFLRRIK